MPQEVPAVRAQYRRQLKGTNFVPPLLNHACCQCVLSVLGLLEARNCEHLRTVQRHCARRQLRCNQRLVSRLVDVLPGCPPKAPVTLGSR